MTYVQTSETTESVGFLLLGIIAAGLILALIFLVVYRRRLVQLLAERRNPWAYVCPSTERLQEFLEGRLREGDQVRVADHLERCSKCPQRLEILEASQDAWSGMARQLRQPRPAPEPALKVVMDQLKGDPDMAETTDLPQADDDLALTFLTPSDQPGHLGRLGPYEVLEVIGRGGMGIVLKAFDPSLQRVVAIKVLAPHLATSGTARRRFIREAQAAAAVSHDHVVTIHAVEETHKPPYLVMQYVAGLSLQQRLDEAGPLDLKEVLRIGMQTAAGLAAAHAQGLVHRDIKPANILLENGLDRVKITDFGLARAADDASVTQSGFVAGTPQYMAPEQARGEPLDHRADLFSLGSTLYAMCTGRPPFRAPSTLAVLRRVADDMPRPIKELNPDIPTWLAAVIEKLHAKHPAHRFQSAGEVAELLGRHLAQIQQPSWVPPPAAPPDKPAPPVSNNGPVTSLTICPRCGCQLHVPEKMVGKLVDCPQCHKPFRVEDSSEELYIVRMDPPRPAEPRQPPRPARPVQPVKPRRRWARWVVVLGLLLLLFLVFSLFVTRAKRASMQAEHARVMAGNRFPAPANAQRWGLDWFPSDPACYGSIDFRSFRHVTLNDPLVLALRRKFLPPALAEQVIQNQLGTLRLDRVSVAFYSDPLDPDQSHLFVRFSGLMNHKRFVEVLRQALPGGVVEYQRALPGGPPITFLTSTKTPWGLAVVGDQDVVAARFQGDGLWADKAQVLLEQVVRVRDGQEFGLVVQPSLGSPGLGSAGIIGFLEGRVPDPIKEWPTFRKWFPIKPGHVALQITRDRQTRLQWVLTPVKAGDETAILEGCRQWKQEAAKALEMFEKQHTEGPAKPMLHRSLASISLYLVRLGGQGAAAPAPPGSTVPMRSVPGLPRGTDRAAPTSAVGGTWILSPEELSAFENLLNSLSSDG